MPLVTVNIVANKKCRDRKFRVVLTWTFEGGRVTFSLRNKAKREDMMVNITEEDQVSAEIKNVFTRKGNPAQIDGDVAWAVSDPTSVELTVDDAAPNKSKASFKGLAGDGVRTVDVTATFDGRSGPDTFTVTVVGQIVVSDADAVVGEMVFGAVEPQP